MILIILLILFCPLAHADLESYAVELQDGSISIYNHEPTSPKTLTDVLKENGIEPLSVFKVTEKDLPPTKADKKYWVRQGKNIVIDTVKKSQAEAAKQAKEARKQALLKMTPAEYQEAKDLGIVR